MYNENIVHHCDKTKLTNVINYCNTTPYTDQDGNAVGKVELVRTECGTNKLLPMDQQPSKVYQYDGVSSNPSS